MQQYIQTDRQLHWLSQVIARINRTFVHAEEDDSHTSLFFDAMGSRLFGRWIDTPEGKKILSCLLPVRRFEWLDDRHNALSSFEFGGKDNDTLIAEAARYLNSAGVDIEGVFKPIHYEIPEYGFDHLEMDDPGTGGLEKWIYFRELANQACFGLTGYLQSESEVRIWPHHFDTGIYLAAGEELGLGFGLAMEDRMVGEPYFYLAGYSTGSAISYRRLPDLKEGHWETGSAWQGAVLPLSKLVGDSPGEAMTTIRKFILLATTWYLNYGR